MRQSLGLIALILFVAGLSFVLSAQDQQGGRPITVTLMGAAEVPGPGDPDGTGTARLTFNPGKNQVCYELKVDKIAPVNGVYLHAGAAGKSGPPIVTLTKECAPLEQEKIMDIIKNPGNYYVNVHNTEFPKGALRGQLARN
jgi:hypothetical protein